MLKGEPVSNYNKKIITVENPIQPKPEQAGNSNFDIFYAQYLDNPER